MEADLNPAALAEARKAQEEAKANTTLAVNSAGTTAMTKAQDYAYAEGLVGDIQSGDTRLPTLNIVHGVGPLSELFDPGSLVYNKELVLLKGGREGAEGAIELVVAAAKKDYVENVEWGSDIMPQIVDTLEEVKQLGGTIAYGPNGEAPSWKSRLTCLVLIKGDADKPYHDYEICGDFYAPAMWTLSGAAFSRAGKTVITAAKMGLAKLGLAAGKWSLGVTRVKLGDNFVYVPSLKGIGKNSPEFVETVRELGLTL